MIAKMSAQGRKMPSQGLSGRKLKHQQWCERLAEEINYLVSGNRTHQQRSRKHNSEDSSALPRPETRERALKALIENKVDPSQVEDIIDALHQLPPMVLAHRGKQGVIIARLPHGSIDQADIDVLRRLFVVSQHK